MKLNIHDPEEQSVFGNRGIVLLRGS